MSFVPDDLGPGIDSVSNKNEHQESPPFVSRLSRKCESLDVSQHYHGLLQG
jgi:hypothetical protein